MKHYHYNKKNEDGDEVSTRRYRECREEAGISLESAASELQVSAFSLLSFEEGLAEPNALVLRRMALLYGCTGDWLLGVETSTFADQEQRLEIVMSEKEDLTEETGSSVSDSREDAGFVDGTQSVVPKHQGGLAKGLKLLLPKRRYVAVVCLAVGFFLAFLLQGALQRRIAPEGQAVNSSVVFERVIARNEMVAASQRYQIIEKAEDQNQLELLTWKFDLPFTTHSYWYRFVGTLKAGVDLSKARFSESTDRSVTVTLPKPTLISNTPDLEESGVLEEHNNILNPIHVEDVDAFRKQCMEKAESGAREGELFADAKTNVEQNIRDLFASVMGDDFEVNFIWEE